MSGNFGYELDLTKLSEEEKKEVRQQVALYKDNRELIQFGEFYRLLSPFEHNGAAWMFVSEDKRSAGGLFPDIGSGQRAIWKTAQTEWIRPGQKVSTRRGGGYFTGDQLIMSVCRCHN